MAVSGNTSRRCMELCAAFYAHLLSLVPGSTSVNELRVLSAIALATLKDEHIGVTELAQQFDIPLSTTSRLVARLSSEGKLIAVKHARDDRRRCLRFSPGHLDSLKAWAEAWISKRAQLAET